MTFHYNLDEAKARLKRTFELDPGPGSGRWRMRTWSRCGIC